MTAYVFPGQGAQFTGMGQDTYSASSQAKRLYEEANEILGFRLSDTMFTGTEEELKRTDITQPAIFLHSVIAARLAGDSFLPTAVAGHSLGEFSALVAVGAMSFADGLRLVHQRATAMQEACEQNPGTMAAVLGMDDEVVERICSQVSDAVVVPANYNSPGQLVISGSLAGIELATVALQQAGARRVLLLPVGGAFHSPLMQPAQDQLEQSILATPFASPRCPIYQNVDAQPHTDPEAIQRNLIRQLTAPVQWTKTIENMIEKGIQTFVEVGGNGKVLQGLIKKIDRSVTTEASL